MGLLDKAATCVVAYTYEAVCHSIDKREQICFHVCCCDYAPLIKSYSLRQLCVDKLLKANNLADNGILGGVPYDMTTLEVAKGYPAATIAAQLKKCLEGAYFTNRLRIPDVTVLKDATKPITQDNIEKLYEIKFPNDKDRPCQIDDYENIAGDCNKVEKLDINNCNCKDRGDPSAIPLPDEVKQAAIDRANSTLIKFIEQHETELFQALREANMAIEATQLGMVNLSETDPDFWKNVLSIAISGSIKKIGGILGKLPVPGHSSTTIPIFTAP